MIDTILILFIVGLGSIMLAWASKFGDGSILRGLARFIDPNYETPEVETARIQTALEDLYLHLTREYGPGWKLTIIHQTDAEDQIVTERLLKQVEVRDSFHMDENFWQGDTSVERFVSENVLEPRQKQP